MSGLDALISMMGADSGSSESKKPGKLDLATRLAALRAKAVRTAAPNPFKLGDLVTARVHADVKGSGEPHVVIGLIEPPVVSDTAECGSNQFLREFNMKVAHFVGDNMTVHAVDYTDFEAWTTAHAQTWTQQHLSQRPKAVDVTPDLQLNDVIRILRGEGQRRANKIGWEKGDLVEILGYRDSNAAEPMQFETRAVGLVETVDHSDDTTRVIYFDTDGDRRSQWFKPHDLQVYSAVKAV
jgi:hypothetical protein